MKQLIRNILPQIQRSKLRSDLVSGVFDSKHQAIYWNKILNRKEFNTQQD